VVKRYLSVRDVAEALGVNATKVIGWINRGELRAVNVAARTGAGCRPRWRITEKDFKCFEASRTVVPAVKVQRRGKRDDEIVQYV
jgi:excisionase family DNA binding protein